MMSGKVEAKRGGEAGFSLVELLIVVLIGGALLLLAARIANTATARVGTIREEAAMGETRASLSDMWRYDFDAAGLNLVRPVQPTTGTEAVTFAPTAGYVFSQGTATRTDTSNGFVIAMSTRAVASGNGSASGTLSENSYFGLVDPAGHNWGIGLSLGNVLLYHNTVAFAPSGTIPPHAAGDTYRVEIFDDTVRFYRARGGGLYLLQSVPVVPGELSYPLTFGAYIPNAGQQITNAAITGSLLVTVGGMGVESAQMPYYAGNRLSGPVHLVSSSDIILFGGDETVDPAVTAADFDGSSGGMFLQAYQPKRGGFKITDVLMLLHRDSRGLHAPLYRVLAVTPANPSAGAQVTLTVERVLSANLAWGVLYSDPADSAVVFPAGSQAVKVLPPIRYRIVNNQFVRQQGGSPETVALGAVSFNVALLSATPLTYRTTLELTGEGFYSSSDATANLRNVIQYDATPRSLNLTSNQLN